MSDGPQTGTTPVEKTSGGLALGLRDSLAIAVGYFPIAVSFGIAAVQAKLSAWMAVAISLFVYAGASQFVLVALFATGASALSIITTVVLMNVRHFFYGPSLLPKLALPKKHLPMPLLAAGLTDEVFAAAMGKIDSIPAALRERWYVGMQLGAYSAWVSGTAVGALMGQQLGQQAPWLQATLGFVLPALFIALLLELMAHSRWLVIATAMLATGVLLQIAPSHWAMLGGMAAGAAFSAFAPSGKKGVA